jgi:hypothetical protein
MCCFLYDVFLEAGGPTLSRRSLQLQHSGRGLSQYREYRNVQRKYGLDGEACAPR